MRHISISKFSNQVPIVIEIVSSNSLSCFRYTTTSEVVTVEGDTHAVRRNTNQPILAVPRISPDAIRYHIPIVVIHRRDRCGVDNIGVVV